MMGSVGGNIITDINNGFQSIADSDMKIDRAYYDISDDFADKVFNTYDSSDLYSYLTQKEQKAAYKDMQWQNVPKQIEYEWKKKAIWRIAKKKAWNELEVWE